MDYETQEPSLFVTVARSRQERKRGIRVSVALSSIKDLPAQERVAFITQRVLAAEARLGAAA